MNVEADLTSEVDIRFKSDYFPLERFANADQIRGIQSATAVPDANAPSADAITPGALPDPSPPARPRRERTPAPPVRDIRPMGELPPPPAAPTAPTPPTVVRRVPTQPSQPNMAAAPAPNDAATPVADEGGAPPADAAAPADGASPGGTREIRPNAGNAGGEAAALRRFA
jgi:hypothetical protein